MAAAMAQLLERAKGSLPEIELNRVKLGHAHQYACRRSWVRVPSSALPKPRKRGFFVRRHDHPLV